MSEKLDSLDEGLDQIEKGNFRIASIAMVGGGGPNVQEAPSCEYSVDVIDGQVSRVARYSRSTNGAGGYDTVSTDYYYPKGQEHGHRDAYVGTLEELNLAATTLSGIANELKDRMGEESTIQISK